MTGYQRGKQIETVRTESYIAPPGTAITVMLKTSFDTFPHLINVHLHLKIISAILMQ